MKKFFEKNLKLFLFIGVAAVMNFTFAAIDILTYSEGYELSFSVNKWRHYTISTSDYYFSGTTLNYINKNNEWVRVSNVEIDDIKNLGGE